MRLLLDTHIFICLIDGNPNLSQTARQAIEDESNTLHLSIVTLWEITIKTSLGKLELAIGRLLRRLSTSYIAFGSSLIVRLPPLEVGQYRISFS